MDRAPAPGTFAFTSVLVFFFVTGSAMALVIWHTLSDFLAGLPVEGGRYLLAMALIGVFVCFAWLLSRYLHMAKLLPAPVGDSSPEDADEIPLPVGTLFLLMLYIMVMTGMWLAIYLDFMGR